MTRPAAVAIGLAFLAGAACKDASPTPDTRSADASRADGPRKDVRAADVAKHDSPVPDVSTDLYQSSGQFAEPCCTATAGTCPFPGCAAGLSCHVVAGGPYTDRGYCTHSCDYPSDCPSTKGQVYCETKFCQFLCRPYNFGCDASPCPPTTCPPGLTCRSSGGLYFECMP
jgi:hypothetical protein